MELLWSFIKVNLVNQVIFQTKDVWSYEKWDFNPHENGTFGTPDQKMA
jgi:hypothetical protein